MKVYIIIARTYSHAEGCWFDVYHNCHYSETLAYKEALELSNKANSEDVQYEVEEIELSTALK